MLGRGRFRDVMTGNEHSTTQIKSAASGIFKSEMPVIRLETAIRSPIERCFDLSRDIELHMRSTGHTREIAVAGLTKGLIGLGEEVTWEANHFGVQQRLTTRITAFSRPSHFRDSQV